MTKIFECKRCGYTTEYKHSLQKHLEKKIPCKTEFSIIDREILLGELNKKKNKTINCAKCGKEFNKRQNKWKHEKICKFNNNIDIKDIQIQELQKKIIEIENSIKENHNNVTNITNNTIISNNTFIINNLRPFGKENYESITEEFIKKNIRPSRILLYKLFKELHFNLNYPENWNFYISNTRSNTANVYRGKKFEIEDKHESIKELVDNIIKFCKTFVVDLESLSDIDKKVLLESFENYEGLNLNNDDYKYDIKDLIKSISMWAYNNKEKIEMTKKEVDKKNKDNIKITLE